MYTRLSYLSTGVFVFRGLMQTTEICEHADQGRNDEIVVKEFGSVIINTGYVCSKCKQPVFVFEDLI